MNILDPLLPRPFRIVKALKESSDVFTLELVPESSSETDLSFLPGQFNMLYEFGAGEVPISISGAGSGGESFLHTIRAVGSVTDKMKKLKVNSVLGLRGPFGKAWPIEANKGKDVVLVAGGIGLAPLRPVIYHIMKFREQYGRVTLLYGARTPKDILFKREYSQWQKKSIAVEIAVDTADVAWEGNVGVVTKLVSRIELTPQDTVAMICGPEIMMRFVTEALYEKGVDDSLMYVSMERNMQCAVGFCGHCQYGSQFICKDGPVYSFDQLKSVFLRKEF
ncbi:MAG: FAD/NAD(P)-binding protein [Bdellovibrionales bacterium]|nr:FAD/NAD(P)-binding protein [Bdellovibrionales bacterium]